jgi:hypothetical protein
MKLAQLPKNTDTKYSSSDTTLKTFVVHLSDGSELHVRAVSWLVGDYGKICFYMQSPEEIAKMSMKAQEPIAVYAIKRGLVESVAEEGAVTVTVKKRATRKTTKRKVKK